MGTKMSTIELQVLIGTKMSNFELQVLKYLRQMRKEESATRSLSRERERERVRAGTEAAKKKIS